ncbi:hypothetical protein VNI00_006309 [Paramarasmius palmivorus]|uniref:Zn(2)-C6 fungal-type domain-containing protein n=1 Tax=Paramarasmius palmivorus TaxID=297713 RepID=A0AAW0D796_9AGAR
MTYQRVPTPNFDNTLTCVSENEAESDREPTSREDLNQRTERTLRNINRQQRRHERQLEIARLTDKHRKEQETAAKNAEKAAEKPVVAARPKPQPLKTRATQEAQRPTAETENSGESDPPRKSRGPHTPLTRTPRTPLEIEDSDESKTSGKPLDHTKLLKLPKESATVEKMHRIQNYTPTEREIYDEGHKDGLAEASNNPNKPKKTSRTREKGKDKEQPSSSVNTIPCESCAKTGKTCTRQQGDKNACFPCHFGKKKCSLARTTAEPILRLTEAIDQLGDRIEAADQSLDDKIDRFHAWLKTEAKELADRQDKRADLLRRYIELHTKTQ